jgi:hypothetical protein
MLGKSTASEARQVGKIFSKVYLSQPCPIEIPCTVWKQSWECSCRVVLLSPRPWDFPPSIDGDVSHEDEPMEVDESDGSVSLD